MFNFVYRVVPIIHIKSHNYKSPIVVNVNNSDIGLNNSVMMHLMFPENIKLLCTTHSHKRDDPVHIIISGYEVLF